MDDLPLFDEDSEEWITLGAQINGCKIEIARLEKNLETYRSTLKVLLLKKKDLRPEKESN